MADHAELSLRGQKMNSDKGFKIELYLMISNGSDCRLSEKKLCDWWSVIKGEFTDPINDEDDQSIQLIHWFAMVWLHFGFRRCESVNILK